MKIKIISALILILFFQNPVSAEAGIVEKLVGTTIKSAVKIVVATTNIKKAKKGIADKLREIDDEEFNAEYSRFYKLIKDLPEDIKSTYGVAPHMTKEQMIENIESVNKKEIYKIINRIPDKTITGLFKEYLKVGN